MLSNRKSLLIQILLILWGLQIIWLFWHFAPEALDLAQRAARGRVGEAIRQEDPYYRWLKTLAGIIPPDATYLFLDNYEAGKEIVARYHLTPRRHVLLPPDIPPGFLFYFARKEQASFLIIREKDQAGGPGVRAAASSPAFRRIEVPGQGVVFQVNPDQLWGRFYD